MGTAKDFLNSVKDAIFGSGEIGLNDEDGMNPTSGNSVESLKEEWGGRTSSPLSSNSESTDTPQLSQD